MLKLHYGPGRIADDDERDRVRALPAARERLRPGRCAARHAGGFGDWRKPEGGSHAIASALVVLEETIPATDRCCKHLVDAAAVRGFDLGQPV